jgi:hypothetical protein
MGGNLTTDLDCPRNVGAGESPRLDLRLENTLCAGQTVRILSTVVGNGDETAGGVGILGPAVAARSVSVPGATDLLSGVCSGNQCVGSFLYCTNGLDCVCRTITPGVLDLEVVVPTPIPAAFDGTVVAQFVFTDTMDSTKTISDSCLINVPEPLGALQLGAALAALTFLRHRAQRARNPEENLS